MRGKLVAVFLAVSLVAFAGVVAFVLPSRLATASAESIKPEAAGTTARYITVVGRGEVQVRPDVAVINVGAESTDPDVRAAIEANSLIMENVVAALADAGIDDSDVQTSNYSVYWEQGYKGYDGGETESKYHVSNMVTVKLRDLDTVGEVLDAVVDAGANSIYGVTFTLEDYSEAQADARVEAMSDATDRASQLAALAGVELGDIISVSEVIGSSAYSLAVAESAAMGYGGASSVAPGQLDVSMSVQVTYAVQ